MRKMFFLMVFAIATLSANAQESKIGFADVDCSWKWLELALLVAFKKGQIP